MNGWSFVKGNETYYGKYKLYVLANNPLPAADKAADILAALCMRVSSSVERPLPATQTPSQDAPTWVLKANVTVFRHADRTPKVHNISLIVSSL